MKEYNKKDIRRKSIVIASLRKMWEESNIPQPLVVQSLQSPMIPRRKSQEDRNGDRIRELEDYCGNTSILTVEEGDEQTN